jgi:hypothetical protein
MEQVVQQNASLVEEASAATESMKEQAAMLQQAVARFDVGDEHATQRIAPVQFAPVHIAPIQVKPSAAALPPAAAKRPGPNGSRAAGQWEEF